MDKTKKFIHENMKCSFCNASSIKGILFKCITCTSYNLCEKCEKSQGQKHGHNFLKIRNNKDLQILKEKYSKDSDSKGVLLCKKLRAGKKYNPLSFQVIDKKSLYCTKNNNDSITIPLTLLNDGENEWPSPCFFTCLEEESNIFGKRVKLVKCSGEKNSTYELRIKLDLSKVSKTGLFTSIWTLKNENGDDFGPKVIIKVSDVFEDKLQIKPIYMIKPFQERMNEIMEKPITTDEFLKMKKIKK